MVARLTGWADGKLSLFIAAGTKYSHAARMFPKVAHVRGTGYDGQFYYRFAFDPFNWHRTAYGITIDHPYRYTRIGYSVAAWVLSAGGTGGCCHSCSQESTCSASRPWPGSKRKKACSPARSGRHALWGLLFAAYARPGGSASGRDTSEPLADACLLGGLLAYRHRKFVLAAALFGYAVFTNEPVLVLPVVLALTRLRRAVPAPRPARPRGPSRGRRPASFTCCCRASSTWWCASAYGAADVAGQPDLAVHRAMGLPTGMPTG